MARSELTEPGLSSGIPDLTIRQLYGWPWHPFNDLRFLCQRSTPNEWDQVRNELRELVWLASMVGGLSVLGVVLAVALALTLVRVA